MLLQKLPPSSNGPKFSNTSTSHTFTHRRKIFTFNDFQDMLPSHRHTIKSIELRDLYVGESSPPIDLHPFTSLESFSAPRAHKCMLPPTAAKYALTPTLKYPGWNLNDYPEGDFISHTFDPGWDVYQANESWLEYFALLASNWTYQLKHIHIEYDPSCWGWPCSLDEELLEYPFDRMDRLGKMMEWYGITLTYSEPMLSGKAFYQQGDEGIERLKLERSREEHGIKPYLLESDEMSTRTLSTALE